MTPRRGMVGWISLRDGGWLSHSACIWIGLAFLIAAGPGRAQVAPSSGPTRIDGATTSVSSPANGTVAFADPTIRAQLTPRHIAVIGAELAGRIAELPVREGEAFAQGQRLLAFDCAPHRARLARAQASLSRAQRHAAVLRQLNERGATSRLELELAQADAATAQAEVEIARIPVERCVVTAPFAGRVAELKVRLHHFAAEGEPLMEILSHIDMEAEMIVPSRWLVWLTPGTRFRLSIDETARDYPAEIMRTGARVDAVSQSVKVHARVIGSFPELVTGMSGTADLSPPTD